MDPLGLAFGGGKRIQMKEPESKRFWTLYLVCVVLFHWHPTMTAAQDCITSFSHPASFNETDTAGLVLLNIPATATETWDFQILSPSPDLKKYFSLSRSAITNDISLVLAQTLDLEAAEDLVVKNGVFDNAIVFEFTCLPGLPSAQSVEFRRYGTVLSVNEFAPEFVNLPTGGFDVSEATGLGEPILVLRDYVEDKDLNPNHPGYDFELMPMTDPTKDGISKFAVGNFLTGGLIVRNALDYESMDPAEAYYLLNVSIGDRQGLTSTSTIRINVIDADDQKPEFWYPGCLLPCSMAYSATIEASFEGIITKLKPAPIGARDLDTMNSPIKYNFKQGDPEYFTDYLSIDETTGVLTVLKPVAETDAAAFFIVLQAMEDTVLQHSKQTTLMITVKGRNFTSPTQPPIYADNYGSAEDAYRLSTIVLGVLFGLVLISLVVFVVCSLGIGGGWIPAMPVLPRAIGKLSSEGIPERDVPNSASSSPVIISSSGDVENPRRGGSANRKMSSDSGVDIYRSLSPPVSSAPPPAARTTSDASAASVSASEPTPPVLSSFASPFRPDSSFLDRDLDLDLLAETNEIDLHSRKGTGDRRSRLSTVSGSELVPYGERAGLMGNEEGLDGVSPASSDGKAGVSNPAYTDDEEMVEVKGSDNDSDVDYGVVPIQEANVII